MTSNENIMQHDNDDKHFALSIDALQFGVLGPDEIRSMSVVEVRDPQQFENGRPVANGPFDLRMGSITRSLNCATCHRDKEECPGHFGHLELQVPVPHPFFADAIKQVLTCVCYQCSELLVVKDENFLRTMRAKVGPKARAALLYKYMAKKPVRVCGYCGYAKPFDKNLAAFAPSVKTAAKSERKRLRAATDGGGDGEPKKRKKLHFVIGRGKDRLQKMKQTSQASAPQVQGSGSIFNDAVCEFDIATQSKPTLDQLHAHAATITAAAAANAATTAAATTTAAAASHVPIDSTLQTACFHIQPRIMYENTNFYMQWPDAKVLYSFLLRGGSTDDDGDSDRDDNGDDQHGQKTAKKRKTRRQGYESEHEDDEDNDEDDEDADDKDDDDDDEEEDDDDKDDDEMHESATTKDYEAAEKGDDDGRKSKTTAAPASKGKRKKAASKGKTPPPPKKKRKKIKDATATDVRRMLAKNCPFHLISTAQPGQRELMSSKQVHDILCRISPENSYLLGYDPLYAHPSWFMLTVLPIPPPCIRPLPDISRNNGKHMPLDDISFKIIQLIKKNNDLAKQRNYRDANFNNYQLLVKHHVMTLIDNKLRGQSVARRTPKGPPLESLSSNLKGKHGRVRGCMLGKRVDFSSRAVVGPDTNLRSDQLGVPSKISRVLTVPETVNRLNIDRLQAAVNRGPDAHREGANYVIASDGARYNLEHRKNITLREGFVVERHLRHDDIVVFNRQPSLHRMSMMGHRVVVHDGDNFRLNLAVTTPYNADFDGDEMNLHTCNDLAARVEIQQLMMVPTQFITPQRNAPIIGLVQDTLLASRLFTKRDTFLTHQQVCQLLMVIEHEDDCEATRAMFGQKMPGGRLPMPAIVRPQPLWSGKQIYSLLLPDDLEYERRSRSHSEYKDRLADLSKRDPIGAKYCDPTDTLVLVRRGVLLCGTIDKKSVGTSGGSFVHIVHNDHGGERCRDMIDGIARCMRLWLNERGFSVGLGDMTLSGEQRMQVKAIKQEAYAEAARLTKDLEERRIKEMPGKTMEEAFESNMNVLLNNCRDEIGNFVQQSLAIDNQLKYMETAGSKGNRTNLASIVGGIGQNNVNGKRIEPLYYGRSTPHQVLGDKGDIEGRGFVASSYRKGLRPREFFFHAMGGREGLVHTAVKTSDTGYIQRRFINILADLKVTYGMPTVRNSINQIVQFAYGEDGMDGVHIEQQPFHFLHYNDVEIMRRYYVGKRLGALELQTALLPMRSLESCQAILAQLNNNDDGGDGKSQQIGPVAVSAALQSEALAEARFMFEARDFLRHSVFRNEARDHLFLPHNLGRLLKRAKASQQMFENRSPLQLSDVAAIRQVLGSLLDRLMDSKNGPKNTAADNTTTSSCSLYARYKRINLTDFEADENRFNHMVTGVPHNELLAAIFVHYLLAPKRVVVEHRLSLDALRWICDEYAREFFASRVQAGEAVGTVAAQSLGEPTTQMTLNTFHLAGVSEVNVTLGLPRLKEIAAAAKNISTPSMNIYLKHYGVGDNVATDGMQIAKKLANKLPVVSIESLLLHSEVLCDAADDNSAQSAFPHSSIERDRDFLLAAYNCNPLLQRCNDKNDENYGLSAWGVRFVLSRVALTARQYTPKIIAAALRRQIGDWALVVESDDNDWRANASANDNGTEQLQTQQSERLADGDAGVIRVYLLAKPMQKELNCKKPDSATQIDSTALANVSEEQWSTACREQFAEQFRTYCCELTIGGCKSITAAVPRQLPVVRYCPMSGSLLAKQQEWTVQTEGINLADALTWPGVDHTRTISNHAIEVQKVLGIEAARAVLLDQFRQVLSFNGAYVDYRHLALLCDTMTSSGQISPVSRHAFLKKATGPYTRAAFEQQTDVLRDAGLFSEYEDGNDMRAAIMMGKRIPQGTGTMFETRMSLDDIQTVPSTTMREMCAQRQQKLLEKMARNPFGFTGDDSDDSNDSDDENGSKTDASGVKDMACDKQCDASAQCVKNPFLNVAAGAVDENNNCTDGYNSNTFDYDDDDDDDGDDDDAKNEHEMQQNSRFYYRPQSPSIFL